MPEPNSGCWLWLAYTDRKGYGTIWFNGKTIKAHRLSWILHNGPVPDGLHVLHKCDIPCCTNPVHLFLGTNQDNVDDMVKKGRHKSVGHPQKLSSDKALEIRSLYKSESVSHNELAGIFGVHRSTISRILSREYWGNP